MNVEKVPPTKDFLKYGFEYDEGKNEYTKTLNGQSNQVVEVWDLSGEDEVVKTSKHFNGKSLVRKTVKRFDKESRCLKFAQSVEKNREGTITENTYSYIVFPWGGNQSESKLEDSVSVISKNSEGISRLEQTNAYNDKGQLKENKQVRIQTIDGKRHVKTTTSKTQFRKLRAGTPRPSFTNLDAKHEALTL